MITVENALINSNQRAENAQKLIPKESVTLKKDIKQGELL